MAPETETYCARCGTSLAPGAYFCLRCGTSVPLPTGDAGATVAPPVRRPLPAQHNAQLDALRKATLGEYEVLAELGRGGMATVYLAHDLALDRKVAIKALAPALLLMGEGMVERFKREARTAAALSHPHIIPIYAVKESEHVLYFVMKYVQGRALDTVIRDVGTLPIPMSGSRHGDPRRRHAAHPHGTDDPRPGGRRARLCPSSRRDPPRHQVREHHAGRGRAGRGHGLRDRQSGSGGRAHDDRRHGGHADVHEPRTMCDPRRHRGVRPVLTRSRRVRNVDRAAAVPGRVDHGGDVRPLQ